MREIYLHKESPATKPLSSTFTPNAKLTTTEKSTTLKPMSQTSSEVNKKGEEPQQPHFGLKAMIHTRDSQKPRESGLLARAAWPKHQALVCDLSARLTVALCTDRPNCSNTPVLRVPGLKEMGPHTMIILSWADLNRSSWLGRYSCWISLMSFWHLNLNKILQHRSRK